MACSTTGFLPRLRPLRTWRSPLSSTKASPGPEVTTVQAPLPLARMRVRDHGNDVPRVVVPAGRSTGDDRDCTGHDVRGSRCPDLHRAVGGALGQNFRVYPAPRRCRSRARHQPQGHGTACRDPGPRRPGPRHCPPRTVGHPALRVALAWTPHHVTTGRRLCVASSHSVCSMRACGRLTRLRPWRTSVHRRRRDNPGSQAWSHR